LLAEELAALAGGEDFHDGCAGVAGELALDFADLGFGGFQLGERDVLFQPQASGERKTLGNADFEPALAEAGVLFDGGLELGIREAAGLVHAAERFLDAEAGGGEIGVLGADAVADRGQRDDDVRFRAERDGGHGGKRQHGQWMKFGHGS
jgi:hypothetical protein